MEAETDHGAEEYDVYVHDAQPLAAGEEKHMLSVFVADEKGLINRVAGVFARRGGLPVRVLVLGLTSVSACGKLSLQFRHVLFTYHCQSSRIQTSLFASTGANIESLAVGLNIDKALFTISVTGNKAAVANLVKQLAKLVKVGSCDLCTT